MTQDQTQEQTPEAAAQEAHPLQGPMDTAQQVAQDIARQQNAEAGAPWADQEERDAAKAAAAGGAEGGYTEATKAELKDQLAERDLPVSGNKDELVARLEEDDQTKTA